MSDHYHVVGLYAENIQRLKAVQINPGDDPVVKLSGGNEAGKTSVLHSIWLAVKGASARKVITQPIRDGEEQARIVLDIGDYVIRRTFKFNDDEEITTRLVIEQSDGTPVRKPQQFLDSLLSSVSFDPSEFEALPERGKRQLLIDTFALDVDKYDEEIAQIKEERKGYKGELDLVNGQLVGIAAPPGLIRQKK